MPNEVIGCQIRVAPELAAEWLHLPMSKRYTVTGFRWDRHLGVFVATVFGDDVPTGTVCPVFEQDQDGTVRIISWGTDG